MEVTILKEDKNMLEVELKGENHTFCNALRAALWKVDDVDIASYQIKHPLVSQPVFTIHTKSGKSRKALTDALVLMKKQTREFKSLLKKI